VSATTLVKERPLHDPPIRRDKKCAVCKGPRPEIEDPKGIYRVYEDPFCSAKCCREFYKVNYDRDMSR
jgi:hypothetical protein